MMDTCKTCRHRIKMESGKGYAMYCDIFSSRRTRNGHLRVKVNQPACTHHAEGYGLRVKSEAEKRQLSLFD